MGKQKAPPAPDYSGIAAANAESAKYSFELGKEQLAWAKETYAKDAATTNRVVDAALETQEINNNTAAKDRARYEGTFQPVEDQFVNRALEYDSKYNDPAKLEAKKEAQAAASMGDVSQQFELARDNARKQLESYGVDPSQTRAGALDLSTRTQEAAARASAANVSRLQSDAQNEQRSMQGTQMLASAIDIGRGYPGSIATQYGTGTTAGNSAVANNATTTGTGANTMGTPTQWQGQGSTALSGWSKALTSGYDAQLDRYKANQSQSSGIGGLLGTALGMATGRFEEGGAVEDYGDDPAMHMGVNVSQEMSPSRGEQTDDVPARLNAGEFVLPEDVVRWFGEKKMQDLIVKGREEKANAGAKPKVQALPVERPQVQTSAPQALNIQR